MSKTESTPPNTNAEAPGTNQADKPNWVIRLKATIKQPQVIIFSGISVLFALSLEYGFSRAMDTLWEPETPEEVIRLNNSLQVASKEITDASQQITLLAKNIKRTSTDDPELKKQLVQLADQLNSLNAAVSQTSVSAGKFELLTDSMKSDWARINASSDGKVDAIPDVILAAGDGVQVCNGLSPLGFTRYELDYAKISTIKGNSHVRPGKRIVIDKETGAYIDYLGITNDLAKFMVNCGS